MSDSEFNKKLKDLHNSPVKKVDDFQRSVTKDLPVEKINTRTVQPLKTGADFQADQIIRNAQKEAKMAALGKMGDTIDYSKFKGAAKAGSKKLLGAIPLLGAGYAALQGDPAMAADELAGDVPVLGQAYEALKPTDSGNVDEERQMLAEIQAQKNYDQSPAHLARLRALQGLK
jgi:hypothetical protein